MAGERAGRDEEGWRGSCPIYPCPSALGEGVSSTTTSGEVWEVSPIQQKAGGSGWVTMGTYI